MKDYVCACTVGFTNDIPLVDVSYMEGTGGGPELTLALLPRSEQIVLLEMTSRVHVDHLDKMLEVATKGCKDMYAVLDQAVREHIGYLGSSISFE